MMRLQVGGGQQLGHTRGISRQEVRPSQYKFFDPLSSAYSAVTFRDLELYTHINFSSLMFNQM